MDTDSTIMGLAEILANKKQGRVKTTEYTSWGEPIRFSQFILTVSNDFILFQKSTTMNVCECVRSSHPVCGCDGNSA